MHSLRNLGLRKWNRILLILIETCPTSNFGETGPYNLRRFQSWIRVTFMTSSTTTGGPHCPLPQQLQRGKPTPLPRFTLTFIRTILYLQDHLQRGSQSKTARAIQSLVYRQGIIIMKKQNIYKPLPVTSVNLLQPHWSCTKVTLHYSSIFQQRCEETTKLDAEKNEKNQTKMQPAGLAHDLRDGVTGTNRQYENLLTLWDTLSR